MSSKFSYTSKKTKLSPLPTHTVHSGRLCSAEKMSIHFGDYLNAVSVSSVCVLEQVLLLLSSSCFPDVSPTAPSGKLQGNTHPLHSVWCAAPQVPLQLPQSPSQGQGAGRSACSRKLHGQGLVKQRCVSRIILLLVNGLTGNSELSGVFMGDIAQGHVTQGSQHAGSSPSLKSFF